MRQSERLSVCLSFGPETKEEAARAWEILYIHHHSELRPPLLTMVNLFRSLSLLLSAGAAYASLQIVPGATVTGVSQTLP